MPLVFDPLVFGPPRARSFGVCFTNIARFYIHQPRDNHDDDDNDNAAARTSVVGAIYGRILERTWVSCSNANANPISFASSNRRPRNAIPNLSDVSDA
jgi:hypothetical protein